MSAESIQIREFRFPEDYPAVYQLWDTAGPGIHLRKSDEPAEIAKKLERDPDLFLVADSGAKIVGTVIGGYDGRRGMMYHLAVSPELRQGGIGQMLMSELEQRLRAKGCLRYYLLVDEDNTTAIQFYRQRGWGKLDLSVYAKDLE